VERELRKKLVGGKFHNVTEVHTRRMQAIRGRGNRTTELKFRALLVSFAVRGWQMHSPSVPGCPDFFFSESKVAVFVDGCFWHGCPRCGHVPGTNRAFWQAKIKRNQERDRITDKKLSRMRILTVRLWEHEIRESARQCVVRVLRAVNRDELKVAMNDPERRAVERVRRAGVNAPVLVILAWVQSVGPGAILSAKLCDIRAVANAF
jgi:DNA mismatch endonuclease, patch repair protein